MQTFHSHTGIVVPMDIANVDTDQIIPKQFLKSIRRTGFGEHLFDAWRYHDEGTIGKKNRLENREFVLNQPSYRNGSILLTRRNFGCGSSREHAVWAILQYGFRCVISSSFADIFSNNATNNGLLLVMVDEDILELLFDEVNQGKTKEMTVDLENQVILSDSGFTTRFLIDPKRRKRLLEGIDNIAMTLKCAEQIRTFEENHNQLMPWLFQPK